MDTENSDSLSVCLSTAVFIWGSERPHTQWPGLKGVSVSGPDLLPGKLVSQRSFHREKKNRTLVGLSVWQRRRNIIPGSLICYGNRVKAKPRKNGEVIKRPLRASDQTGRPTAYSLHSNLSVSWNVSGFRKRQDFKRGFWGKDEDKDENINTLCPGFLTIPKQWGCFYLFFWLWEGYTLVHRTSKNMNSKAVFVLVSVRAERI